MLIWIALLISVLCDVLFGVLTKYSTDNASAHVLAWWARLICGVIAGAVALLAGLIAWIFPGLPLAPLMITVDNLTDRNIWLLGAISSFFLLLGEYFRWRSLQKESDPACTLAVVELYPVLAGVLVLFLPVFGTNPTWKDTTAFVLALAALLIANWPQGGKVTQEVFLGLLFMTIEICFTLYGRLVMHIPTMALLFVISVTGTLWWLPMARRINLKAAKWGAITATVNMFTIIPFLLVIGMAPLSSKPIMLAVTSLSSTLGAIVANVWFKKRWSTKKVLLIAFLGAASVLTM
ncbi:MAG: hypothetical protein JW934_12985 [Anaerolineae bacterium]|nr:hypothetical protein [Anaerolineae bacterium]